MSIDLSIMDTPNTTFNKIYFLHSISLYHFTYISKEFYIHSFFSFEIEELVSVIFILFAAFLYLLFQIGDACSECI